MKLVIQAGENQSSRILIYLRYFETLSILLSTQSYVILETTHNEKKLLKRLELL